MERELHLDDLDPEEFQALLQAIDVLAALYPMTYPRKARQAWYKWLHQMIEMRAPSVRQPVDEPANDA